MDVVAVAGEPEVPQPLVGRGGAARAWHPSWWRAKPDRRWADGAARAANATVVVSLWWRAGGASEVEDTASGSWASARITGLLGAYLVLIELLLLARMPCSRPPCRLRAADAAGTAARWAAMLVLLRARHADHGRLRGRRQDRRSPTSWSGLITGYPGVITAIAGLARARRRRGGLGRRSCGGGIARDLVLRCPSTPTRRRARVPPALATGTAFVGGPPPAPTGSGCTSPTLRDDRRFQVGVPVARSRRHRLRVDAHRRGGPEHHLDRDRRHAASSGCARAPGSLRLALPHPRPLVRGATVLALRRTGPAANADHGERARRLHGCGCARLPPGTRMIAEGPSAPSPAAARRRHHRADRRRDQDHADPRAARGHAGRARRHRGGLSRAAHRRT